MLANITDTSAQSGALSTGVHPAATFRFELLAFITDQLPRWRDDPERPIYTSEPKLTEYLCDHLNSAARKAPGWDILQFRTEVTDEQQLGRKIDLAPKPCGVTIWIDGRGYTQYDILLPIECKRLPTPPEGDRDEREYVFNRRATTGGIQRFKAGHHGAAHTLGAMIAYVQEETTMFWDNRVAGWIKELVDSGQPGWTAKDLLYLEHDDEALGMAAFRSRHTRKNGLQDIELRHLWVKMN